MENSPAAAPPAASTPRTDRLELVKELGRGSLGVVHKAKNSQLDRVIALRQFEVPEWLDDAADLLKKIVAEARAASALDHPNIAKLYTCGYKNFTVFITAEFVEGKSLKEVMAERQPEMPEVLAIAKQLCAALDYAYEKGVVHHFLNPSNIKLMQDGTLKVLDYGLLKDKNLLSQTPAKKLENEPYLSPEQVKGKPVSASANLFSAAAILYQLYTGRSPFAGKHLGEVDRNIADLVPPPLNLAHPRVPPSISAVILKELSKSSGDRYKNGRQFVLALEDAMKGVPPAASTPKPAAPTAKPSVTTAAAPVQDAPNPFGGYAPVAVKPAPTPAPQKPQTIAPPTPTVKVRPGGSNVWKILAAVVGCLVIVAGAAAWWQHRAADVSESNEPPVAAKAKPVRVTATPTPEPQPQAVSEPASEPAPEPTPELEAESNPIVASVKKARAARIAAHKAAPAPAGPQVGELFISSVPSDAAIEIDGFAGQVWHTPQSIGQLLPGTYKVTVAKPGYASDVRSVQVSAGNRINVDARLNAVKGWLNVAGSPAGANIFVDGRDTGKVTPASLVLDPARHNVLLRKAGYLDTAGDIQLAAGQTTSYAPTLMVAGRTDNIKIVGGGVGKIFGGSGGGKARIEIKSDPKGAQVLINGTPLQKTTPLEIQVEAGNYDITILKEGYQSIHENAIVGVDDHVKINKALMR